MKLIARFVHLGAARQVGGAAGRPKTCAQLGAEMLVATRLTQVQLRTEGLRAGGGRISSFGIFPGDRTGDPIGHCGFDVFALNFCASVCTIIVRSPPFQGRGLGCEGWKRQQDAQHDAGDKLPFAWPSCLQVVLIV